MYYSSHPTDPIAATHFSFMDMVYPEDRDHVMAQWNTLSQGSPVTFEMRWNPRPGTNDNAQWVLSACVPIFDDDKNLIRIAGNTIDINAQKRSQEATEARVEALEQARLSEMKFARFAQLSPTAIYIFVPGIGESPTSQTVVIKPCTRTPFHYVEIHHSHQPAQSRRYNLSNLTLLISQGCKR
jgi:hypothetical protein